MIKSLVNARLNAVLLFPICPSCRFFLKSSVSTSPWTDRCP